MKYDLIVVGGGPGGLMAAKTAAEDGLNVVVIERKRNVTEIKRACMQIFYTHKITGSPEMEEGKARADGYIDPVSVEILPDKCQFHFPVPGFSIDYEGSLLPYYNWIGISPSGYQLHRHKPNNKIWGFFYQKEVFLAGLLASAQKAGAKIMPETIGMGAENTPEGVKVLIRGKSGEQTLEARKAIAADGVSSNIVDSLGLNQNRQVMTPPFKIIECEMDGLETNLPGFSMVRVTIPSLNPFGPVGMGLKAENRPFLWTMTAGTLSPGTILEKFMEHPNFAHWFRHARVVKKMAAGSGAGLRTPIREPVAGNVLIVGDATAPVETWIQGAVACGYMAVKAIKKELDGQKGCQEYIDWWRKAFAFNDPHYWKVAGVFPLNRICSDEEGDYLYSLFQGTVGCDVGLITNNLELIKTERPELYEKLIRSRT